MSDRQTRTVMINGRAFKVTLTSLSPLQIRALAGLSPDDDLIAEGSGEPDRLLAPGERIELSSPVTHIFSRPPTSFG
ncbi:multiubiquitin domain-containing protein [Mesorhizobium sp. M1328]|uniref:multiubiquitin domain-containing protein n=1 Tax=Mesorhizobium sp. M1328 TaxID=2957082 RepID=UPI00333BDA14